MPWGRRFLPDAGEVHPDLLAELGEHALTPDAVEQLLSLAQPRLRRLFHTTEPVASTNRSRSGRRRTTAASAVSGASAPVPRSA